VVLAQRSLEADVDVEEGSRFSSALDEGWCRGIVSYGTALWLPERGIYAVKASLAIGPLAEPAPVVLSFESESKCFDAPSTYAVLPPSDSPVSVSLTADVYVSAPQFVTLTLVNNAKQTLRLQGSATTQTAGCFLSVRLLCAY
jgi:hypothetical protein